MDHIIFATLLGIEHNLETDIVLSRHHLEAAKWRLRQFSVVMITEWLPQVQTIPLSLWNSAIAI